MKLELRDVVVRYGTGDGALTAVDGVSFGVPTGRTVGLVGESGCGKSSIARAVVGLVPVARGQVLLDDRDFSSQKKRESMTFRRKVQMVFQDPYSSLNPRMSIAETLSEVMPRGTARGARRAEALRVLDLVGLAANTLERYPHQFSGGQRQRIAIARALASRPDIIICDEVTSSLDVSVQAAILNVLKDLQKELQISYVFISHDLASVRYMSDVVAVMYLGRIVEIVDTRMLFDTPRHPYTRVLMRSIPRFGTARVPAPVRGDLPDPRNPPRGCRFHTRCPIGPVFRPERTVCVEQDPQDAAADDPHRAACHFAGERLGEVAPETSVYVERTSPDSTARV